MAPAGRLDRGPTALDRVHHARPRRQRPSTRMILARAPLRISLGGGGTDLPSYYSKHGGFILSGAIDKYVYIHVNRPAADELIRLKYSRYEQVYSRDEVQHDLVRPTLKCLNVSGS